MDMTIHNGRRWNTANAYLRPAMSRPNLEVRTCGTVSRVVVENGKATGVAILQGKSDREEIISAETEVILSAGAINSPQVSFAPLIDPRQSPPVPQSTRAPIYPCPLGPRVRLPSLKPSDASF